VFLPGYHLSHKRQCVELLLSISFQKIQVKR
jgi:hypothetical protein